MMRRLLLTVFVALLVSHVPPVVAQQVYVSTPSVNVSDGFYEWFGLDWGYRSRGQNGNFFFHRGSSQGTMPRFGGFDPASASRLGFATLGGKGGLYFNLTAAQGSRRSITSTTPSVNLTHGAIGSVRDVQLRPFVTGLIPVLGSRSGSRVSPPVLISPLRERLARLRYEQSQKPRRSVSPDAPGTPKVPAASEVSGAPDLVLGAAKRPSGGLTLGARGGPSGSSAERGDISIAEIRRRQAVLVRDEADDLNQLIKEAKAAELMGRYGAARVRYRQAAARATGDQRRGLLERFEAIRDR
jgi:hypothetical protein